METRIESQCEKWKDHNTKHRIYVLGRSCTYESTPSEGNLPPRLTVRIFVHELRSGKEIRIGEISIFVDRDRWKDIAGLDSVVQADNQLREVASSARGGNWNVDPLPKSLRKACQIILSKIAEYESDGQPISGKLSIWY